MIKKRDSLSVLFIVTLIMVILMFFTIYQADDNDDQYGALFPELFDQLSDVNRISFTSSEGVFTLERQGEDWFLQDHFNYPANFDEVKRTLIDLSDAKILEKKTAQSDEYFILGVEGAEPKIPGGQSKQIVLSKDDEVIAGLLLGEPRELKATAGPQQFFVRRMDDEQSWLAEGYFQISPVMLNWIDSTIINVARERIASVEIIQPNGETATLINLGEKDKFGLAESRERTIFKYPQLGYDIAGSLFEMRLEDVMPVGEFSRAGAEVVTARYTTFDGLVVISRTSFIDGFYYTTLNAEANADINIAVPDNIRSLDVLKSPDEVLSEAESLNNKLSPWVYRVSGFVGTNLMRAKADIVTERSNVIPMPADMTGFGP